MRILVITTSVDIVTKKKLNILIQLAMADKDFASAERALIYRIAREKNYPEEAVDDLIEHPESIGTLGALSEKQKLDYLLSSVELVLADHKVHEREVIFMQSIAIKLGFLKNVVAYLLANFGKMSVEDLRLQVTGNYRLT